MDLHLEGKKTFLTGSSRGLGYAAARLLAMEGAQVVINGRDEVYLKSAAETLSRESGSKIYPVAGDVSETSIPEKLVEQAVKFMGGLDILITNSGGPPTAKFDTLDDDDWYKAFDLTLMSHVRLIRAALPYLRQSQFASVLTITSYSVKQPIPNLVLSNSIRAATVGLTKTLALELGSEGIRFNSILPAWTQTGRIEDLMEARAKIKGTTAEEEFRLQSADSPLGRMGKPEEFANAAVFLVSPAASYITGVMLTVDGGMYKGTI